MKVFEILSLNLGFLKMLHEFGIKHDDYQWVSLYLDYKKMKMRNEKTSYIVAFLGDKYNICERKVYKVLRQMDRDCHIGTA